MPSHRLNAPSGVPSAPVLPADGGGGRGGALRHASTKSFRQVLQVGGEGQRGAMAGSAAPKLLPPKFSSGQPAAVTKPLKAEPTEMKRLAIRALDAEKKVEALLASTGKGRTFSASELIALQATVFRYSQTVEVLSRTTDKLVGALKQTLGTQV